MINLTANAISQFKTILRSECENASIFLKLEPTGCSGFSYKMEIVSKAQLQEIQEYKFDTVSIVIANSCVPLLINTTIDYVKDGLKSSFHFLNPNEKDRCGCGASFRVR